jgi:hypothetical protein
MENTSHYSKTKGVQMGGKYINKSQVRLYMKYRENPKTTQVAAAAIVGISVRSGRTIEKKQHHTFSAKKLRSYKTRRSPIDAVWDSELTPMLEKDPTLQSKTLLIYLQRKYLNDDKEPIYTNSVERSLQRKVARWLALNGAPKDVIFPQVHVPGVQALSDFTHFKNVNITINSEPFKHMFYHFRLVYSKWSYLKVIQSGESMQALSEGMQEALFSLGGSPQEHRTDSLSAAFKNISTIAQKDLTDNYERLCAYFNMKPTRNNKGVKHENGSVESAHGHLKNRISQELILRGSEDFKSLSEYERWVHDIVKSSNKRNCKDLKGEILALQKLPRYKTDDYEVKSVKISNLSIIIIKNVRYSVPSSLSGHTITIHIYQNIIQAYLGDTLVFSFDRKFHIKSKKTITYAIDYKHVIHSLIKKPAAFRQCKYRDELFPNDNFRHIWNYLDNTESIKVAPKIFLRLLKLASDYNCEIELGLYVIKLIEQKEPLIIDKIEKQFIKCTAKVMMINCKQHDLSSYDHILNTPISGGSYATT